MSPVVVVQIFFSSRRYLNTGVDTCVGVDICINVDICVVVDITGIDICVDVDITGVDICVGVDNCGHNGKLIANYLRSTGQWQLSVLMCSNMKQLLHFRTVFGSVTNISHTKLLVWMRTEYLGGVMVIMVKYMGIQGKEA